MPKGHIFTYPRGPYENLETALLLDDLKRRVKALLQDAITDLLARVRAFDERPQHSRHDFHRHLA
jgi:hypothetical protein